MQLIRSDVRRLMPWLLYLAIFIMICQIIIMDYLISSQLDLKDTGLSSFMGIMRFNNNNNNKSNEKHHEKEGTLVAEQALELLSKAGVELTEEEEDDLVLSLRHSSYHTVYGKTPVIMGMEHCQSFRDKVKPLDRFTAPVGLFNSGTNLVWKSLENNCYIKERVEKLGPGNRGMRLQPPWGKHTPLSYRGRVNAISGSDVGYEGFLPIVILKDPFTWMSSLCRHYYSAIWLKFDHCPNLVPTNKQELRQNDNKPTVELNVYFNNNRITYSSMVDWWNTWYNDFVFKADFPRLIIRFEDLLFHSEEIVTQICECVGGELEPTYKFTTDSAKDAGQGHHGSSNLYTSLMKYANTDNRFKDFTEKDKEYAMKTLRPDLMKLFHY